MNLTSTFLRWSAFTGSLAALALTSCLSRDGGNSYQPPAYNTAPTAPATQSLPIVEPTPTAPVPVEIDPSKVLVRHTIVPGDSLWKLARDYKTRITEIKQVNDMTDDVILAGQTILIPTNTPPEGAVTMPQEPAAPAGAAPQPIFTNPPTGTTPPVVPSPAPVRNPDPPISTLPTNPGAPTTIHNYPQQ